MQDLEFMQANKVFTGRLRDNKEKGHDKTQPRVAIEKEDLEKLFIVYFLEGINNNNTEVLLHKVFFDIIYYTGRHGKEGLRNLTKDSFTIKKGPDGADYIEMTYNEKTKKNQGEATSTLVNSTRMIKTLLQRKTVTYVQSKVLGSTFHC